jgi:hypothetical protein
MEVHMPPADREVRIAPEPILSFVETGRAEVHPRLLVARLLYARSLICASPALELRFRLGDCAAAHHFVLGDPASGLAAAARLLDHGFRVEAWRAPGGIRCFVSSAHSEAEIRALLTAVAIVIREQAGRTR